MSPYISSKTDVWNLNSYGVDEVLIDNIQELKPGHQSEVKQWCTKEMPTSISFTIVFKGRKKNVDLVAVNATEACLWIYVFTKFKKRDCSINKRVRLDQY
ncbi:1-phosphatidylinositol 4,5-bisphosphate phosphodiesterase delta-4-like [Mobula hypostoma]|uniref:1-phosphatidylinositol 4,5-bisphosphate phosphodiesterase delta-4-like n=1 Tax=Mobula hypostoma TaxID=723540 RepID=UPI002FC3A860